LALSLHTLNFPRSAYIQRLFHAAHENKKEKEAFIEKQGQLKKEKSSPSISNCGWTHQIVGSSHMNMNKMEYHGKEKFAF
jgi:hypothetical protein